jgi:hypothetical protein
MIRSILSREDVSQRGGAAASFAGNNGAFNMRDFVAGSPDPGKGSCDRRRSEGDCEIICDDLPAIFSELNRDEEEAQTG